MDATTKRNFGVIAEKVFLDNKPRSQALSEFLAELREIGQGDPFLTNERIPVTQALGRIVASEVTASRNSPHFSASAMDGIAVRAAETFGASDGAPKVLTLDESAVVVDTGDLVPAGYDAVIMNEYIQVLSPTQIQIHAAAIPGQHVRQIGEDMAVGDTVLKTGMLVKPWDIGACLAAGVREVEVLKKPRVAIMPTGTELVDASKDPEPGELVEFNSHVLKGLIEGWGAEAEVFPITPDDEALLQERFQTAWQQFDLVVVNAGSSAGREDFTASLVEKNGRLLTHGVAIKPGKPVILGLVGNKPVFGLPGYPVAAALTADLFLRPVLELYTGQTLRLPVTQAVMGRKAPSPLGVDEYVRVTLERNGNQFMATPIKRGSGVISSLVNAQGWVMIPACSEGVAQGETVEVTLLREV